MDHRCFEPEKTRRGTRRQVYQNRPEIDVKAPFSAMTLTAINSLNRLASTGKIFMPRTLSLGHFASIIRTVDATRGGNQSVSLNSTGMAIGRKMQRQSAHFGVGNSVKADVRLHKKRWENIYLVVGKKNTEP